MTNTGSNPVFIKISHLSIFQTFWDHYLILNHVLCVDFRFQSFAQIHEKILYLFHLPLTVYRAHNASNGVTSVSANSLQTRTKVFVCNSISYVTLWHRSRLCRSLDWIQCILRKRCKTSTTFIPSKYMVFLQKKFLNWERHWYRFI